MRIPSFLAACLPSIARIIGLLTLAASLTGCSAIKLAYNNFDEVAYWWLDSYLDLTDDQSPRLRQDLERLQQWHRIHELPEFIAMLHNMEALAPGEISPAQACAFVPRIRERLKVVAHRAEPPAVTLAISLEPEQLAHLERKYQKTLAEYRKDWVRLPPSELHDKRMKQFLERSEMIYGRLDDPQRQVLRSQMEQSVFDAKRVMAERQRRQQDALQTLRKLAGQPISLSDARVLISGLMKRVQESPDPEHRRYQQALIDEGCRTFSALHNSTSPPQREAAVRRLRAYQRELRELTAQQ
jgi:hypothetical protein